MTNEPTTYDKNTKEQYESLGRFIEAFESMVQAVRVSCIGLISLDSPKRIHRLAEIAFHHQSLTAKPLFDMFRAMTMETVTDADFRKFHEISDVDCDYFTNVFSAASLEYMDLVNKRNSLLHGTWFIGYPSDEDEHSSSFYIQKLAVTKTGLLAIDLPKSATQLQELSARCDKTKAWISRLYGCIPTHPVYFRISHAFRRTDDKWELVQTWQETPVAASKKARE